MDGPSRLTLVQLAECWGERGRPHPPCPHPPTNRQPLTPPPSVQNGFASGRRTTPALSTSRNESILFGRLQINRYKGIAGHRSSPSPADMSLCQGKSAFFLYIGVWSIHNFGFLICFVSPNKKKKKKTKQIFTAGSCYVESLPLRDVSDKCQRLIAQWVKSVRSTLFCFVFLSRFRLKRLFCDCNLLAGWAGLT